MLLVAPLIPKGLHAAPEEEPALASSLSFVSKVRALTPLILPPVLGVEEAAYNLILLLTLFASEATSEPEPVMIELESDASSQRVIPGNSVPTVDVFRV